MNEHGRNLTTNTSNYKNWFNQSLIIVISTVKILIIVFLLWFVRPLPPEKEMELEHHFSKL